MEDVLGSEFRQAQEDLLFAIQRHVSPVNEEMRRKCCSFLKNHNNQLSALEDKSKIHQNQRGRLDYRLQAEETVTLEYLKEKYGSFARHLNSFTQFISTFCQTCSDASLNYAKYWQKQAVDMACRMIKMCLVLANQPVCGNYGKKKNEIPALIFLGAHELSGFEVVDSQVSLVRQTDLQSADRNKDPLDDVTGLTDFQVVSEALSKSKNASSSKSDKGDRKCDQQGCLSVNLGVWHIEGTQDTATEKGSTHKAFVRLRFKVKVKYRGQYLNQMLLSLPFNIRKGSSQLFTFIGSLMWYFFSTPDPYQDFSVTNNLAVSKVFDMLVARIETIGRKLSPVARQFLMDRLDKLSSNGQILLETLAKGPPTNKNDSSVKPIKTPTVDETIDKYGFFTWFFALVRSLDESGYQHQLWKEGFIYDLCDKDHIDRIILQPTFGFRTVILRPSLSSVENYQGEKIHMELAMFYKSIKKQDLVISQKLTKEEVDHCPLVQCITLCNDVAMIYKSDGVPHSLDNLPKKADSVPEKESYHGVLSQTVRGKKLLCVDADSTLSSGCSDTDLNMQVDVPSQSKKCRNSISTSSEQDLTLTENLNLTHKRRMGGPVRQGSRQVDTTPDLPMTPPSQSSCHGSPQSTSVLSPDEARMPFFGSILSPGSEFPAEELSPRRQDLIQRFNKAAQDAMACLSDDKIAELTNHISQLTIPSCPASQTVQPTPSSGAETRNSVGMHACIDDYYTSLKLEGCDNGSPQHSDLQLPDSDLQLPDSDLQLPDSGNSSGLGGSPSFSPDCLPAVQEPVRGNEDSVPNLQHDIRCPPFPEELIDFLTGNGGADNLESLGSAGHSSRLAAHFL